MAVLVPFDTADEAIDKANDTEYGLVAYVYTDNLKLGLQVAERVVEGGEPVVVEVTAGDNDLKIEVKSR